MTSNTSIARLRRWGLSLVLAGGLGLVVRPLMEDWAATARG